MRLMCFNFLQFYATDSFMGVIFSFAKIFVFCVKLCLLLSIQLIFLLLKKTFLQFFSSLNIQLFSGTYLYHICQTYDKPLYLDFQLIHQYQPKLILLILSKTSSETDSGIPLSITLFLQPYCAKALWSDSYFEHHFSNRIHLCLNFSISSYRFLIKISLRLMYYFIFEGVNSINYIVLHALYLALVICDWLLLLSSCIITMARILIK